MVCNFIGESGPTLIPTPNNAQTAGVGFCIHFPPRTIHRIEALEDAYIVEVSTPQLADVFRLADDYGRVKAEAVAAAGK